MRITDDRAKLRCLSTSAVRRTLTSNASNVMDKSIDITEYLPTRSRPHGTELDAATSKILFDLLSAQTRAIKRYPYDPALWLQRARTLVDLDYPELACGDAWKAEHCCNTLLKQYTANTGIRLGANSGFWMTNQRYASDQVRKSSIGHLQDLQSATSALKSSIYQNLEMLEIVPQPYPWLALRHRTRSDALLQEINHELATFQPLGTEGQPYCTVKRGAHNLPGGKAPGAEALGIFARRAIPAGTTIIKDRSEIWACTDSSSRLGRENLMTSSKHSNSARLTDILDEAIPQWIKSIDRIDADRALLRVRCLIRCIDQGVAHPLEDTIVARLSPAYHTQERLRFSEAADIVPANRALLRSGIDILANQNFDTWVLMTIDARLSNNCWSEPNASCLNSLFALFNHSCEPNVIWERQDDQRTVHMRVNRYIEAGEQLFVQYHAYLDDRPIRERQQALRRWLADDCNCNRCTREVALQVVDGSCNEAQSADWNSGVVNLPGVLW